MKSTGGVSPRPTGPTVLPTTRSSKRDETAICRSSKNLTIQSAGPRKRAAPHFRFQRLTVRGPWLTAVAAILFFVSASVHGQAPPDHCVGLNLEMVRSYDRSFMLANLAHWTTEGF